MRATIADVQYHPNNGPVAVLVVNKLSRFYVNLDQAELTAAAGGGNWGDDEVLAAVQAKLDADPQWAEIGFEAVWPEAPVFPATEEPAAALALPAPAPETDGAAPENP